MLSYEDLRDAAAGEERDALMRAFADGCSAVTGTEAVANGVPAFKPPEWKNAQTTMLTMATLLGVNPATAAATRCWMAVTWPRCKRARALMTTDAVGG